MDRIHVGDLTGNCPQTLWLPLWPCKVLTDCVQPDLRGNAFPPVSWSLCFSPCSTNPVPVWAKKYRGEEWEGLRSSFEHSAFHREGGVGLRLKSFHFCSCSYRPALSSLPVSHSGDDISSQPIPHCGFSMSSFSNQSGLGNPASWLGFQNPVWPNLLLIQQGMRNWEILAQLCLRILGNTCPSLHRALPGACIVPA